MMAASVLRLALPPREDSHPGIGDSRSVNTSSFMTANRSICSHSQARTPRIVCVVNVAGDYSPVFIDPG